MNHVDLLSLHGLSATQAHLGALALTLSYVGSLYLTKPGVRQRQRQPGEWESPKSTAPVLGDIISQDEQSSFIPAAGSAPVEETLQRDHPTVIKSRIKAVSTATVVGCVGIGAAVGQVLMSSGKPWTYKSIIDAASVLLGFTSPPTPGSLHRPFLLPYILAPLLFIGPLYTTYLDKGLPFQRFGRSSLGFGSSTRNDGMLDCLRVFWTRAGDDEKDPVEKMKSGDLEQRRWIELRNCVAGPVSEELVFRSCIIAVYQLGGFSNKFLVFVSPLWFGVGE
ncbi:hypothetical protein QFC19_005364 [Naganishia cerealis]|uniref:Uncharacterized protein n=1 Tax=Naganishia cerealis TaxID=610337 RepID=A0ACC2VPE9_9TREE|nr:hypothetical protein QFC19_005364 [Naganishia cerealis]